VINICFAGVTGWTAPPIVAAIDASDDLSLTCAVSRSAAGKTLAEAAGSRSDGTIYASVSEALQSAQVDVLVDYTSASAVKENVWTAVQAGVHVVVGSSGLTAEDYHELDQLARDSGVGVVAAGNFSIMAAILQRAAALAAEHLENWEIIDYASAGKPDVPSGTARELAEILAKINTPSSAVALSQLSGPVEARGGDVAGTQIHSVRLPSFVVSTEIVFGGAGERLIMRHDAGDSPDPYVEGTVLAIRKVIGLAALRVIRTQLICVAPGHYLLQFHRWTVRGAVTAEYPRSRTRRCHCVCR
jgi:4-hydroxy-tetrahydrodipicolinate reductase